MNKFSALTLYLLVYSMVFSSVLYAQDPATQEELNAEIRTRAAADNAIITSFSEAFDTPITQLLAAFSQEVSVRSSADVGLQDNIDTTIANVLPELPVERFEAVLKIC